MIQLEPIAHFFSQEKEKADLPRQGVLEKKNLGRIEFVSGRNFEQALQDLRGIERIWVLFWMHETKGFCIKVQPPRFVKKKGVFATRSPHRPNPIGLTCVVLREVSGLSLIVEGHDILDGSPVLDIKPYLPYADSFPEAKVGWLDEEGPLVQNHISFSSHAAKQLQYLEGEEQISLQEPIEKRLRFFTVPSTYNRVRKSGDAQHYELAYKSWRIHFYRKNKEELEVLFLESGYTTSALEERIGPDIHSHIRFLARFTRRVCE